MKKIWQERWMATVVSLGLVDIAKEGKLTKDQQKQITAKYENEFKSTFEADKKANKDVEAQADDVLLTAEEQSEVATLLMMTSEDGNNTDEVTHVVPTTSKEATSELGKKVIELDAKIKKLEAKEEPATPAGTVKVTDKQMLSTVLGQTKHTATHLFGIEHPVFARGKWWSEITATGKPSEEHISAKGVTDFMDAFNSFTSSIKSRVNELAANKQLSSLDFNKMIIGETPLDYGGLQNVPITAEYMTRRQDLIIAYLRTLPSVANIFPVRSGVQNKQEVTNAFFGEFSSSYIPGRVFKGSAKFTPEFYSVVDVMFKHMFTDLKSLESQYIGYLNKEGSNPMKWAFIEWLMVNIFTILFNEQQRRRVIGVTVPVQQGVDNPANLAADGVLRALERIEEEFKVLPFFDLKTYDKTTIVQYFEEMWGYVDDVLPSIIGMRIHANKKHQKWYLENYRELYGRDIDFTGVQNRIIDLSPENIVWVPNMDKNDYKVWITIPGNIENYELTPGEMYAVYFQQDLEALMSASWWKEGSGAQMSGLQCASTAELMATGRKLQFIFTNFPVTDLVDGATTLDGSVNTIFETGNNTAATAINSIVNASQDRVYKVVCGGLTNATTIKKLGIFSKISADWVPTAIGDYIKLYAELALTNMVINGKTVQVTAPTGNYLELERKVSA
jgi:hypothetical protein